MLVKELYNTDNGFMANVFQQNFAELFNTVFGTNTSGKALDMYVIHNWGCKTLLNDDIDTNNSIIGAVISINKEQWQRLFETLTKEYDVINVGKTTTDTESTNTDSNNNDTQTTSKTTYDGGTFKDTDKIGNIGTVNQSTTRENKHTETDNSGNTIRIANEIALRQKTYRKAVLQTLIDEITLQIFNV